jgi:hypothetical protein
MGIMVMLMLVLYMNFLNNKETSNSQNLSPDQMIQGVQNFMHDMTSSIKPIPVTP